MPEYTTWLTRSCYGIELSFAVTAIIDVSPAYPGGTVTPAVPAHAEVAAVEITVTEDERALILDAWEKATAKNGERDA